MALKDIFNMIKADRYTADGREQVIKAQEAETEDRTYNIGEISQKTGLQKTANGWVKPAGLKGLSEKAEAIHAANSNTGKPDAKKDASSGSKSSVDIIKEKGASKINHIKENHPYASEDDINSWLKEEWNLGDKDKERILNEKNNFGGLFSINDPKLTNSFNQWYKRNRNKKWYAESKSESKPAAEQKKTPKPTMQQYMKAKQNIKKFEDTFKKQKEQYEARQRMGEGAAALSPLWGLKPNDYKNDPQYKKAAELVKAFEAEDSAPRVLTGDTKIRVRKA